MIEEAQGQEQYYHSFLAVWGLAHNPDVSPSAESMRKENPQDLSVSRVPGFAVMIWLVADALRSLRQAGYPLLQPRKSHYTATKVLMEDSRRCLSMRTAGLSAYLVRHQNRPTCLC